jgi:hypothetical protein
MILIGVLLSACSSLPEENAKLRGDISRLQTKLLQSYREGFEKYEYPKLDAFAKQGYNWFWQQSLIESSGCITKKEEERILKEHGKTALELWKQGWSAAHTMWNKSCGRDSTTLEGIFPTHISDGIRRPADGMPKPSR